MKAVKKHWPLGLVIIISFVGYWRWLNFSVFTNGDWHFTYANTFRSLSHLPIWNGYENAGSVDLTFWHTPVNFMNSLIALSGSNQNVVEKLTVFWPVIILTPIAGYFLVRAFVKSKPAQFVGTIVYCFNTYYLAIGTQGHEFLTLAGSFATLSFVAYKSGNDQQKWEYSIISSTLLWMAGVMDFRLVYIMLFVLAVYVIFEFIGNKTKSIRLNTRMVIAFGAVQLGLNLFWLLPIYFSGEAASNGILGRELFGGQYWNLESALTLFHPFWSGGHVEWFVEHTVPIYMWLTPLGVIGTALVVKKNKNILYALAIGLMGIFLTKQTDAPFANVYPWLYVHLLGFNAFREATKFYYLIIFSYSILLAYLVESLWEIKAKLKMVNYGFLTGTIFVALFLFNLLPMITGSIGTLFTSQNIPAAYISLNEKVNASSEYSRSLYVPFTSTWSDPTNSHPIVGSDAIESGGIWSNLSPDSPGTLLSSQFIIKDFFQQPYAQTILAQAGVRNVIVPARSNVADTDSFLDYGDQRDIYTNLLSNQSWLKRSAALSTGGIDVYQTDSIVPYVSATSQLINLPSLKNLANTFSFVTRQINKSFDFVNTTLISKKQPPYTLNVTDIFGNLFSGSFSPNTVTAKLTTLIGGSGTLAVNTNHPTLRYQTSSNSFDLFESNPNYLKVGGRNVGTNQEEQQIDRENLSPGLAYYLSNGASLSVMRANQEKYLGTANGPLTIYSSANKNLIPNPSLEAGLWQSKVDDCNDYDDNGIISMSLDSGTATDGDKSLALSAFRHTACTGPNAINVTAGASYRLAFDYKVAVAKQAGYRLTFNDPAHTVINDSLLVNDTNWRTFSRLLTVPVGATQMAVQVLGFTDDQYKQSATTNYDAFSLTALNEVNQVAVDVAPHYTSVPVTASTTVAYEDPSYSFNNLVANPSFESGLWQKKVGDCNNYDNKGKLGMKLSTAAASDGHNSLELDATRHIACTGPSNIVVQENSPYFLSFDYQSPNATNAGYYVSFNDPAHTVYTEQLPINDSTWHTFSKTIKAPDGATAMSLLVYSYADDLGDRNIITRYDNFHVLSVPNIQGSYFLTSQSSTPLTVPKAVLYTQINATKKTIHVAGATTAFYLNMSEAYHDKWQLEFNNAKLTGFNSWLPWAKNDIVPASDHYDLDTFANGWYIDVPKLCGQQNLCIKNADGSYNLNLVAEFTPQRWFYVGAIISGGTLISLLGTLSYFGVRRLKRKTKS